ncbi:hypothetical protein A7A09_011920 [Paracoccus methylarcula]|uniref:Uncharacterized protein n=1 Tax=Paracoccus methylarcula TaxID=72022 RepID=A0A3R7P450_9RHOB|nr:hypothetical protein A7A09_011920 [Paracoccus methylarcula]
MWRIRWTDRAVQRPAADGRMTACGQRFIVQPRMKPNPQDNVTKAPVRRALHAERDGAAGRCAAACWALIPRRDIAVTQ